MKKLENYRIGVDHGDLVLFSDFDSDGPMWSENGPRERRKKIAFSEVYRSPPVVTAWISMMDVSNAANLRLDVQAENVTKKGFEIVFRSWGDTQVARARVAWQSIGELSHDDDWEINS